VGGALTVESRRVAIDLGLVEGAHRRGHVRMSIDDDDAAAVPGPTVLLVDGARVSVEHLDRVAATDGSRPGCGSLRPRSSPTGR